MGEEIELAGIEYHGVAGSSLDCQTAVERLLQFGDHICKARIISHENHHCLLLTKDIGDVVAIKSGFSSGYGGTGPRCFSYILQLLELHGTQIDECKANPELIERLDNSSLTVEDLDRIKAARPVRPSRWREYVDKLHYERAQDGTLWCDLPPVIPFAVIDPRIADLALSFWENPDGKLLRGYRRLEDVIRKRTGLTGPGEKLFSQAFLQPDPKLQWKDVDEGARTGRAQLFTGAFKAHRNPRSHGERKHDSCQHLTEFLLLGWTAPDPTASRCAKVVLSVGPPRERSRPHAG